MMQKFVDRKSSVWVVDIDSTTLRRVKAIAGVNLLEFVEGDLVERLSHDFLLLGDILYAVCKPKADQQGISDEEFGQGLAGDVLSEATAALLEGLVAFFPEPRRRLLKTAAAKYQSVQTKAMELVQMKLDSPDLEAEILDKLRSDLEQATSNGSSNGLGHVFAGICDPSTLDLRVARQEIFYDRLNEHYRPAHQLAWLILDSLGISDVFSSGRTRVFSFMLDMNRLFESFVLKVIERLLIGSQLDVHYQRANRSIICHAATNKPYSRVVPDFLLQRHSRQARLVLDAKYKLYDTRRVSTSDVYQAFLYAYAFGCEDTEKPTAGLICPAGQESGNLDELSVRSAGNLADAKVVLIGLPIPTVLDEMKANVVGPGTQALRTFLSNLTTANQSDAMVVSSAI